jgi:hypothetical protein
MSKHSPPLTTDDVLRAEWTAIAEQRAASHRGDAWFADETNRCGIALSGGGIRAATIACGFVEILNRFGLLEQADYLSTVSGGGYLGGYVHSSLWRAREAPNPFGGLFSPADRARLTAYGKFLAPGTGARGLFSDLKFGAAFLASLLLNWTWIVAGLAFLSLLLSSGWGWVGEARIAVAGRWLLYGAAAVLTWHLLLPWLRHIRPVPLWSSDVLNRLEAWILAAAIVYGSALVGGGLATAPPLTRFAGAGLALVAFAALGFFVNPNLLTMHRFYRDRLAAAYLWPGAQGRRALRLYELSPAGGRWRRAPYPLINTCLNLLGASDPRFKGAQTSDYFLLSPLHCGSKLTGYRATRTRSFRGITLATAVACSGAAVNPEMGWRSMKALTVLMSLLNLRLGYWARNPRFDPDEFFTLAPWWPAYQLLELLSRTDSTRRLLNISDGGHIENLGVYELLRRRCRLIIALDATGDPQYTFGDLRNLLIRARQELGVTITFRQRPEEFIRPPSSDGFSRSQFVVADIAELPGRPSSGAPYTGVLVYVKSSLRAQRRWKNLTSESFAYKTYHPAFPHESTANQFFDPAQWEAYYNLGRFMAGDLLREDCTDPDVSGTKRVEELFESLARLRTEQNLEDYIAGGSK